MSDYFLFIFPGAECSSDWEGEFNIWLMNEVQMVKKVVWGVQPFPAHNYLYNEPIQKVLLKSDYRKRNTIEGKKGNHKSRKKWHKYLQVIWVQERLIKRARNMENTENNGKITRKCASAEQKRQMEEETLSMKNEDKSLSLELRRWFGPIVD